MKKITDIKDMYDHPIPIEAADFYLNSYSTTLFKYLKKYEFYSKLVSELFEIGIKKIKEKPFCIKTDGECSGLKKDKIEKYNRDANMYYDVFIKNYILFIRDTKKEIDEIFEKVNKEFEKKYLNNFNKRGTFYE